MDRANLWQYLTAQYAPILAVAAVGASDDPLGGGPVLDMVMRHLGLDTQDVNANPTLPAGTERDAQLLTRYYTLDWLLPALAMQVTISDSSQKQYNYQRFKQTMILLEETKKQVPSQYQIEPGDFSFSRLQLDIFEPWYTPSANPSYTYP